MSNAAQKSSNFYVVGGTMKLDAPSYIERKADEELYKHILAGDFCYILTPRQMGKSSLMARTAHRLKKEKIKSATIDLTRIGAEKGKKSPDQWYYGIAHHIVKKLGIETKLKDWWREQGKLPAVQRLTEFFNDILLASTNERVVIFVDEIDTTIVLPFTDDFFAAIRACYNARATESVYQRLSFVLLGVATPSELIKDTRRTPFNIGRRIDLTDFTFEEAKPLSRFLGINKNQKEGTLKRILYWTSGHPYLTQKLCHLVANEKIQSYNDIFIDELVKKYFLGPDINYQDSNINFVRDRLMKHKKYTRKLLNIYRHILKDGLIRDEPLSHIHTTLKLSGVVVPRGSQKLGLRNRIYEGTFTKDWISGAMPTNWRRNIVVAFIFFMFIGFFSLYMEFLKDSIRSAEKDVPYSKYQILRKLPGQKDVADELYSNYWERRGQAEASKEERDPDKELLYYLQALKVKETDNRYKKVCQLITEYQQNRAGHAFEFKTDKTLSKIIKIRDGVNAMTLSPDGENILTGNKNGKVQLWRTDTDKPFGQTLIKLEGAVLAVAFSPICNILITASKEKSSRAVNKNKEKYWFEKSEETLKSKIQLWYTDTSRPFGKPIKSEQNVKFIALSLKGKKMLAVNSNGRLLIWKKNRKEEYEFERVLASSLSFATGAFSPDGRTMVTGTLVDSYNKEEARVRLWNVKEWETLEPNKEVIYKNRYSILSVTFSPDGNSVIAATRWWIHQMMIVSDDQLKPKASRLLPGSWIGAYRFLDDKGDKMQVVVRATGDSIKIITLRFDISDSLLIEGNPGELLEEWQRKLALELDEEKGEIKPMSTVEVPERRPGEDLVKRKAQ